MFTISEHFQSTCKCGYLLLLLWKKMEKDVSKYNKKIWNKDLKLFRWHKNHCMQITLKLLDFEQLFWITEKWSTSTANSGQTLTGSGHLTYFVYCPRIVYFVWVYLKVNVKGGISVWSRQSPVRCALETFSNFISLTFHYYYLKSVLLVIVMSVRYQLVRNARGK